MNNQQDNQNSYNYRSPQGSGYQPMNQRFGNQNQQGQPSTNNQQFRAPQNIGSPQSSINFSPQTQQQQQQQRQPDNSSNQNKFKTNFMTSMGQGPAGGGNKTPTSQSSRQGGYQPQFTATQQPPQQQQRQNNSGYQPQFNQQRDRNSQSPINLEQLQQNFVSRKNSSQQQNTVRALLNPNVIQQAKKTEVESIKFSTLQGEEISFSLLNDRYLSLHVNKDNGTIVDEAVIKITNEIEFRQQNYMIKKIIAGPDAPQKLRRLQELNLIKISGNVAPSQRQQPTGVTFQNRSPMQSEQKIESNIFLDEDDDSFSDLEGNFEDDRLNNDTEYKEKQIELQTLQKMNSNIQAPARRSSSITKQEQQQRTQFFNKYLQKQEENLTQRKDLIKLQEEEDEEFERNKRKNKKKGIMDKLCCNGGGDGDEDDDDEDDDEEEEPLINNEFGGPRISSQKLGQQKWDSLCRLRAYFRVFCFLIFIVVIGLLFEYFQDFKYSHNSMYYTIDENTDFNIRGRNCLINMMQSDEQDLKIDYFVHFNRGVNTNFTHEYNTTTKNFTLVIESELPDLKYCVLEMYLPKKLKLFGDFKYTCGYNSECITVYKGDTLTFKNMNFTAPGTESVISLNLENIQYQALDIFTENRGLIYFQNIDFPPDRQSNTNIKLQYGEVVIQSLQEYSIKFDNPLQSICYNAPYVNEASDLYCDITDDSIGKYNPIPPQTLYPKDDTDGEDKKNDKSGDKDSSSSSKDDSSHKSNLRILADKGSSSKKDKSSTSKDKGSNNTTKDKSSTSKNDKGDSTNKDKSTDSSSKKKSDSSKPVIKKNEDPRLKGCIGTVQLCKNPVCASTLNTFNVRIVNAGNIYANVIDRIGYPPNYISPPEGNYTGESVMYAEGLEQNYTGIGQPDNSVQKEIAGSVADIFSPEQGKSSHNKESSSIDNLLPSNLDQIEKVFKDEESSAVPQYNLLKGKYYDVGLQFNDATATVVKNFYASAQQDLDPIWIIDIGYKWAQQSIQTLWVKSANPTFALMRPWWLSTLSFGLLVTQTTELTSYLQPGFCPYSTSLTLDQYWEIKQFLARSLNNTSMMTQGQDRSSITFVQSNDEITPQQGHFFDGGIKMLKVKEKVRYEEWYDVIVVKGLKQLDPFNSSKNPLIFFTILASIFCALLIVAASIYAILRKLMPTVRQSLSDKSGQFEKYTSTVKANDAENQQDDDEDNIQIGLAKEKKAKKIQPSFVACFDFYSFLQTRKGAKSHKVFFEMIFLKGDEDFKRKIRDGEIEADDFIAIKERKLKSLYEKFCFLNHLTEDRLSDDAISKELEYRYGYGFVPDNKANKIFVKLAEKRSINIPEYSALKISDSLSTFIQIHYDITGRETDDIWVEDMEEQYKEFCNNYRLRELEFIPDEIARDFNLILGEKPQQKLVQKGQAQSKDGELNTYYIITEQIEHHFTLMTDQPKYANQFLQKLTLCKVFKNELWDILESLVSNSYYTLDWVFQKICKKKANDAVDKCRGSDFTNEEACFMDTVYGSMWMKIDFMIVVKTASLNFLLILPMMVFLYINQISYYPYSQNHPLNLLSSSSIIFSIVYIPWFMTKADEILQIGLILIFSFLIIKTLSDFYTYFTAKFPVDKAFEKNKFKKPSFATRFQFFQLMILVSFAIFYLSINLLWLLLGAIINPNFFLVYASSVITLLTFVASKIQAIGKLIIDGIAQIKDVVLGTLTKQFGGIMDALEAEKAQILNFAQEIQDDVKSAAELVVGIGAIVGLGAMAKGLVDEIDNTFNKVKDTKNKDELTPQVVEEKSSALKKKLETHAQQQIVKDLNNIGFPNNLSLGIKGLVLDGNKKDCSQEAAKIVSESTDGAMPNKLISWILNPLVTRKTDTLGKDLQDTMADILLEPIITQMTPEQLTDLKKLVFQIMRTVDTLEENSVSAVINNFKNLALQLPLKPGETWSYSSLPKFSLKFLEIFEKLISGETTRTQFGALIQRGLSSVQIPDDINFFITLLPVQLYAQKWELGAFKFESIEQVRQFIDENIIQKVCGTQNNPQKTAYLSYYFAGVYKLCRGGIDFRDEVSFFKKEINTIISQTNFTQQQAKSVQQFFGYACQLSKFLPLAMRKNDNVQSKIQSLAAETKFPTQHVKGMVLSGTTDIYMKLLQGKRSREGQLREDHIYLADLCQAFGVEIDFFLGLMDLYHDKGDFDGRSEDIYMEAFNKFLYKALKTTSESQKFLVQITFSILRARTLWELNSIDREFEVFLEQKKATIEDYRKKIGVQIMKFLKNGDHQQLQQFISQSYVQIKGDWLVQQVKYFIEGQEGAEKMEEIIRGILKGGVGRGNISLAQTKRTNIDKISTIDFICSIISQFGMADNSKRLIGNLFKIAYLRVDSTGHDRNDRVRLIKQCGQDLKINEQMFTQMMAFLDISHASSKEAITSFYQSNPQIIYKGQKIGNAEELQIEASVSIIIDYIQQLQRLNSDSLNKILDVVQSFDDNQQMEGLTSIAEKFLTNHQIFKVLIGGRISGIHKEALCDMINQTLQILQQLKVVQPQKAEEIMKNVYRIFFMKNLDTKTLIPIIKADKLNEQMLGCKVDKLIQVLRCTTTGDYPGVLEQLKNAMDIILQKDKKTKELVGYILSILAVINIPPVDCKFYDFGNKNKRFSDYFPLSQYRFVTNPSDFVEFVDKILNKAFQFDSITTKQLIILFSIFGENPAYEAASEILSLDKYIIELGSSIAQLVHNNDPEEVIERFERLNTYSMMCKKGKLSQKELPILLKLALKCLRFEDLDNFVKVFKLDKQMDSEVLKGLFAFLLPIKDKGKDEQTQKTTYFKNYESRKQFFSKITTVKSKESFKYEYIEMYFNLARGRFYNIFHQISEQKAIKKLKMFGGQRFLKYGLLGTIGYIKQKNTDDYEIPPNFQQMFNDFKRKKLPLQNGFHTSLYFLSESILDNYQEDQELFHAFSLPALDDLEYKKIQIENKKNPEALDQVTRFRILFYYINNKVKYSDKIKIIEYEFLIAKLRSQKQLVGSKDADKIKALNQKIAEIVKGLKNKRDYIGKIDYDNPFLSDSTVSKDFQLLSTTQYSKLIIFSTLQEMKTNFKKSKNFDRTNIKYILNMDLILTAISRQYLLDGTSKQTEFFRKNAVLTILAYINQPAGTKQKKQQKFNLYKNIIKSYLPSNPSCYIEQTIITQDIDSYPVFQAILYNNDKLEKSSITPNLIQRFTIKFTELYLSPGRFEMLDKFESLLESDIVENDKLTLETFYNAMNSQNISDYINILAQRYKKRMVDEEAPLQDLLQSQWDLYLDETKISFLKSKFGIKESVNKLAEKYPDAIGSDQTKGLLINILQIQNSEERNFDQIQSTLFQLEHLTSNQDNLFVLLNLLCNPFHEHDLIKQFTDVYLGQIYSNEFNGVFLTQLLNSGKYYIKDLIICEGMGILRQKKIKITQLREQERQKTLDSVQEEATEKVEYKLTSYIQSLLQGIKISHPQLRMLGLLIKCYIGSNEAWAYLYEEKFPLFKDYSTEVQQIGNKFITQYLSYVASILKLSTHSHNIQLTSKIIKGQSLQKLMQRFQSNNTFIQDYSVFREQLLAVQLPPGNSDLQKMLSVIINEFTSNSLDIKKVSEAIFNCLVPKDQKEFLSFIPFIVDEDLQILWQARASSSKLNNENLVSTLTSLAFKIIPQQVLNTEGPIIKNIMRVAACMYGDEPLARLNCELLGILNSPSVKQRITQQTNEQYENVKLLTSGCLSAQIVTYSQTKEMNDEKAEFLVYFGSKLVDNFIKAFYGQNSGKRHQILQDIQKQVEDNFDAGPKQDKYIKNMTNYVKMVKDIQYNYSYVEDQICGVISDICNGPGQPQATNYSMDNSKKSKDEDLNYEDLLNFRSFAYLLKDLDPIKQVYDQFSKQTTPNDKENSIYKLINLLLHYFNGYTTTDKDSIGFELFRKQEYKDIVERLVQVYSGEEAAQQDKLHQFALKILFISQMIGFDSLLNNHGYTTDEFLNKYDFMFEQYFEFLEDIFESILDDKTIMDLITPIKSYVAKIQDTVGLQNDPNKQKVLFKGIYALFLYKVKENFNNQTKTLKDFDDDDDIFGEYQKNTRLITRHQKEIKKAHSAIKNQKIVQNMKKQQIEKQYGVFTTQANLRQSAKKRIQDLVEEKKQTFIEINKQKQILDKLQGQILQLRDANLQLASYAIDFPSEVLLIVTEIEQLQKVYKSKILSRLDEFRINGFDKNIFVNQFVPLIVSQLSRHSDASSEKYMVNVTESIISLIDLNIDDIHDEFFQMINISIEETQRVRGDMKQIINDAKAPMLQLEKKKKETLDYISNKKNDASFNNFNQIKEKMKDQQLSHEDMFHLADLDGQGDISQKEFKLFFKKVGFDLSDHRINQIFAQVKQGDDAQSGAEQSLNQEEFVKAYDFIQSQTIQLTLESMGISQQTLYWGLFFAVLILLSIFVFIFLGVSAFAIPGTFGAVVNSAFPMMGGGAVSKQGKDNSASVELGKVKKAVQNSMSIIQNSKI